MDRPSKSIARAPRPLAVTILACFALSSAICPLPAFAAGPATSPASPRVPTPEVRTESGALRGLALGGKRDVYAYKGIPYAAPPVGELRWKPPQPAKSWPGVRDCFEFGAACPQAAPILMPAIPELAIGAPLDEDCLFLNIWVPAAAASAGGAGKLPVLYWIHGGGFVMGAASQPLYDGEELARLGCVVVSVNYRLGLFGFLAHPSFSRESSDQVSGNYGLLDQLEGLRWLRRNIAAFGGDPGRVTIFGESAGGISVLCQMVMPDARGLFHGAIAQSATAMDLPPLRGEPRPGAETAESIGRRLIKACGLGDSPEPRQMRELGVNALVQAALTDLGGGLGAPLRFKPLSLLVGPNVDGHVIPDQPNRLFAAGREHPVPLIVGATRDEMSLLMLATQMPADADAFLATLKQDFGDAAGAIARAYPVEDALQVRAAAVQLATDLSFTSESRFIARAHAAAGHQSFRYQCSLGTPRGFLQMLGAHHGAEVAYLFQRPLGGDEGRAIGRTIGRYWLSFAATGTPSAPDAPPWPAYRAGDEAMINFDRDVTVLKAHHNERLDLIEKFARPTPADASSGPQK